MTIIELHIVVVVVVVSLDTSLHWCKVLVEISLLWNCILCTTTKYPTIRSLIYACVWCIYLYLDIC